MNYIMVGLLGLGLSSQRPATLSLSSRRGVVSRVVSVKEGSPLFPTRSDPSLGEVSRAEIGFPKDPVNLCFFWGMFPRFFVL